MEKEKVFFDCGKFISRVGLSRKELAFKLGLGESTVGNWCTGSSTPNYLTLAKMCELGLTAQEMFGSEIGDLLVKNSSENVPPPQVFKDPEFKGSLEDMMVDILKKKGVL